ncbi:MFS transporter [Glutamicibacter creatinolyticus]|uniref:MFS transporter n=1 Tax=Glutamicibacter creatinolyticus TaxID=162496 RepID=UPI0037BEFE82
MPSFLMDVAPLRQSPAYRRLWIGNSLSAVGTQMTLIAVSLEVYALTQSSFHVGLLGAFTLVPLIITGLYGGAIADTHDRRKVALYSALALWVITGALALQAWLQVGSVWVLYGLMALHSAAAGINQPTRGAIIPSIVRRDLLPAANSLNMVTFGVAQMVGPLLGGLLVAQFGYQWTYSLDAITFTAAVWSVFRLPALPAAEQVVRRGLSSVIDGLRYLKTQPNISMTFLIDMAAMILAAPRALLPAIGAVMIGGGETTVGILLASAACGALLAGLFSGTYSRINRQGVAVFISVCIWGVAISGLGVIVVLAAGQPSGPEAASGWLLPAMFFMLLAGIADSISSVFRTTILQVAAPDQMRGRLQGVFIVVVAGGPRVGEMLSGGAAGFLGEGLTLVVGGLCCVLVAVLLVRWRRGFLRYDSRHPEP